MFIQAGTARRHRDTRKAGLKGTRVRTVVMVPKQPADGRKRRVLVHLHRRRRCRPVLLLRRLLAALLAAAERQPAAQV